MAYDLIGKYVRVHLYDRAGHMLGTVTGRVADVSMDVQVAPGMTRDLAYVVDIDTGGDTAYRNSAGGENESWFAIQDLEVIGDEGPRLFAN